MVGVTGAYSSLQYRDESSFKTPNTADTPKVFGRGQKLSSVNIKQNLELIYELGVRTAQKGVFKQFEGTLTVEWILSNPWFLKLLMGTYTQQANTPSTGLTTHNYAKANTLPTAYIENGLTAAMDVVRKYMGCVLNSVTLSGAVNDVIKARGDFMFAKEEPDKRVYTGTVSTAGTTTLTGTSTTFTTDFKVGDRILVSGETARTIATIPSDTSLTVTSAFSTTASGLTYVKSSQAASVDSFDPFTFEHASLQSSFATPTVTNIGTAGVTTYTYFVIAIDASGNKITSPQVQTTTGNATLNGTNFNRITWTPVMGALKYDVLKTNNATVITAAQGLTGTSYDDTGTATGAYTAVTATNFTVAEVQSIEITIANNVQMIWGLGDPTAAAFVPQALDITGRINVTFKDASFLDATKSRTEYNNLILTITNSGSGTNLRSFTFTGIGNLFDEHSTGYEPNVLVLEDVPIRLREVTVAAVNTASIEP